MNPEQSTSPSHGVSKVISLWYLAFIAFVWMSVTMCACGHTSWHCSIGIIPVFSCGSYLFFGFSRRSRLDQLFGAAAFALIVLTLIKNFADILYFGHTPFLR